MAKPITATPEVKGEAALKIWREMRDGTPNTPKRDEFLKRADETFRRFQNGNHQTGNVQGR